MESAPETPCHPMPFTIDIGHGHDTDIESFRAEIASALQHQDRKLALAKAILGEERFARDGNLRGQANALFLQGMIHRHLEDCPAALHSLKASLKLWETLDDSAGIIRCFQECGGTSVQKADYPGALFYFQECLAVCLRVGAKRSEIAARSNIATLYIEVGDCAAALEGMHYCLPYQEEHGTPGGVASLLHSIAEAYNLLDQPEEAIRFALRGYAISETVGENETSCYLLSALGTAYRKTEQYEKALLTFQKALVQSEKLGVRWIIALISSDLGRLYIHLQRFDEARDVLERSLQLNGSQGHRFIYAQTLKRLGKLYADPDFSEHCDQRALELLGEARQVAEDCDSPMLLVPVYQALTDLYEQQGELKEALTCLRLLHRIEKRLFNEQSDRRIKSLELEKVQKDAEILHLRNVELAEALAEAERLRILADQRANTDALTGLQNRWALDTCLEEEWEYSLLHHRPFAIALLDIDYFKRINDTFGHAVGDRALVDVADLLRSCCRPGDQVARYGGEEFAILFPDTQLYQALEICECLRKCMAEHDWSQIEPQLTQVTISGGVSAFNGREVDKFFSPFDLLQEADKKLYRAKRDGRNQVTC